MAGNGTAENFAKEELERFEQSLLERRRVLMQDVQGMEEEDFHDASENSRLTTHLADLGSDRAASDVSLGRRESATHEVQQIDEALERVRDGSFGLCENCDLRIARDRIEAIPYARLCLPCKQEEEKAA
jgi:DnaK suppressor protein